MLPVDDSGWLNLFTRLYNWSSIGVVVCAGAALLFTKGMQLYSERVSREQTKQIAEARRSASVADERAGNANKAAGEANERAARANIEAGRANERAGNLEKEASDARRATEELRKTNIEAGENLEAEKRERLALEEFLSPRSIGDQLTFNKTLSAFPGITAVINVVPDGEARRVAETLAFAMGGFGSFKWNVQKNAPMDNPRIMDGISVEYNGAYWMREGDTSGPAAKALVDLLNERKVDSHTTVGPSNLLANVIVISIGLNRRDRCLN